MSFMCTRKSEVSGDQLVILPNRYNMTAGMTLTGPANSSLEDPPYKRHQMHPMPHPASPPPLAVAPPPPSYKLPPDLELSKAEDGEGMEDDVDDISSASAHNHKNRQVLLPLHNFSFNLSLDS